MLCPVVMIDWMIKSVRWTISQKIYHGPRPEWRQFDQGIADRCRQRYEVEVQAHPRRGDIIGEQFRRVGEYQHRRFNSAQVNTPIFRASRDVADVEGRIFFGSKLASRALQRIVPRDALRLTEI